MVEREGQEDVGACDKINQGRMSKVETGISDKRAWVCSAQHHQEPLCLKAVFMPSPPQSASTRLLGGHFAATLSLSQSSRP